MYLLLFMCDRRIYLTWHAMLPSLRMPKDLLDSHILNLPTALISGQPVTAMPYFSLKLGMVLLGGPVSAAGGTHISHLALTWPGGEGLLWRHQELACHGLRKSCHTTFFTLRSVSFHSKLQLSETWIGREMIKYISPSPQHYMVRHSYTWHCCSIQEHSYRCPVLWEVSGPS